MQILDFLTCSIVFSSNPLGASLGSTIYAAWLDQRKRFGGLNREEICGCAFKIHIPAVENLTTSFHETQCYMHYSN